MKFTIDHACIDPDRLPFDAAERKGIGHPDSLADLVADTFSRSLLRRGAAASSVSIPNHWVDKVNLVGAAADVRFGGFDIHKPVDCYLFGKITDKVGDRPVPVEEIFQQVITEVLPAALGDDRMLNHLRLHVNNTSGVAVDHDPRFYRPGQCRTTSRGVLAGRVGRQRHRDLRRHEPPRTRPRTWRSQLERLITSDGLPAASVPVIGTDVKVMVVRVGSTLDITAAVPFHPEPVDSWAAYRGCAGRGARRRSAPS